GIATQDKELRKNFKGTPEHVINFFFYIAEELRGIMAQLGFRTMDEMIGQTSKINSNKAITHYKAKGLDLSSILHVPEGYSKMPLKNTEKQDHALEGVLDFEILKDSHRALFRKEKMTLNYPICNMDRSVGAIVSNEISKVYGHLGLPEDTLSINFTGSAGQSFGVFGAHGLTFTIEGNSNDYLGKGLSGAKIIVKKPAKADFIAEENIIVGNVCLFGAIEGEAYINGIAGERFAVRNSGATAVVEGVGDHGCEYMTGGKVVVLGKTGRNFAAGMSGGIAYIYDPENKFTNGLCNTQTIEFEPIENKDAEDLKALITKHVLYTNSNRGKELLENWDNSLNNFVKVMPIEYKRALKRLETEVPMVEELTA
uniref:GltB/FmdC/FwdC-like GXGXG domain-containing protein n=1 Tax=Lutibacter sp. TaxID=1925666 RepID=UPI00356710F8